MTCQKETAKVVIGKKADYFLALKRNHGDLYDDIKTYFEDPENLNESDFFQSIDKGHGRIEIRKNYATDNIDWLKAKSEWRNLRSIVMINFTNWVLYALEKMSP